MGRIKNFQELAKTSAREAALAVAEAGLAAIDTGTVVSQCVRITGDTLVVRDNQYSLGDVERVLVVGVGKCALAACAELERILGSRLTAGIAVDVRPGSLERVRALAGTHPFPTEANIDATREIISLLSGKTERDLVIFVISGGGSTLLCQPGNFTCHMESAVIRCLFAAGATIKEINTIRKHLSMARGGHLAKYAYPAKVISLIFSDVAGDDLQAIASGPTVRDQTTVQEACEIMEKYSVESESAFSPAELMETPKEKKYFEKVENIVLVNNALALEAMSRAAAAQGLHAMIMTAGLSGEASLRGKAVAHDLHKAPPGSVLLYGGETTVSVRGRGRGGRNLELALSALPELLEDELVLALNTDGRDNCDYAGAICDTMVMDEAHSRRFDPKTYLRDNNSYEFFDKVGGYLRTGDTGCNIADLIIALKKS